MRVAAYKDQEESGKNDADPTTEPVDAQAEQNHTKDITDEDRVGEASLHISRHLLRVPEPILLGTHSRGLGRQTHSLARTLFMYPMIWIL